MPRDIPTVSLNLSVGLSSFAQDDIVKMQVRVTACAAVASAGADARPQNLGFAPNWVDAISFMNTRRSLLFVCMPLNDGTPSSRPQQRQLGVCQRECSVRFAGPGYYSRQDVARDFTCFCQGNCTLTSNPSVALVWNHGAHSHFRLQVSLNDSLFGVGSPVVAAVDLIALQPIVTYEDPTDVANK